MKEKNQLQIIFMLSLPCIQLWRVLGRNMYGIGLLRGNSDYLICMSHGKKDAYFGQQSKGRTQKNGKE